MSVKLKKDRREPVRIQLKKNDQVKVIAGRDRGKTGRILDVDSKTGKLLVEHVNMIKRHTKKNPAKQIAGGIAEKEAPIAVSNVMIVCSKCGPGADWPQRDRRSRRQDPPDAYLPQMRSGAGQKVRAEK